MITKERWMNLCLRIGAEDNPITRTNINARYNELIAAYTGPDRHYHNLDHINDGLEKIDKVRHLAWNPDAIEMAWWWHDFVYNTKSKLNEDKSAEMADNVLREFKVSIELRAWIIALIYATKHIYLPEPEDYDLCLMIDIDLASLGAPPEIFDRNTANIRKEQAWLSIRDFRKGRVEFFRKMLKDRPSVYLTQCFRDKYEAQAQENLKRTMAVLND